MQNMSLSVSERRIRNNKRRRARQLRRNILKGMITFALVISFSLLLFTFKVKAQSNAEEISYKYYKSIMISSGSTLWDFADTYADDRYYGSMEEYVHEVMEMNHLNDESITAGQYIILPYYSNEFA